MPIKDNREYRKAQPFKVNDEEFVVEGYASTFKPYVLWEYEGKKYMEQIDPHAFDNADMSDVILQYDHEGRVYARQSNGSLELKVDDNGLHVRADLSRSSGAKALYEDIQAGLINQMSFAFIVEEDSYNRDTRTRTILKIKKVFDVSAVSIPANPTTEIGVSARSYFEGVIEAEKQEMLERETQIRRIKLMLEV